MPSRTEAARRLFAVLEAHGWTDGDRERLAPLLLHLNAHRQLVTRGALTTVLYGGREPTAALVSTLARRLSVPLAQFHAPRPPKAHKPGAHPLSLLEPIDDVRTIQQRKQAGRKASRRGSKGKKLRIRQ
jgi:hypothetical protein